MGSQLQTSCSTCQPSNDNNMHRKRRSLEKANRSGYFAQSKIELTDFKFDEERIPEKTLITIESGHLIAHILKDFFTDHDNICHHSQESTSKDGKDPLNFKSILDNIFIVGGACRDFLLNRPINDLDISCNVRELTKLYLLHLNKYHSSPKQQKDMSCVFWRLYLKKFDANTKKYDLIQFLECNGDENAIRRKSQSYAYVGDCDYLINAKFIAAILIDSELLFNKLSVRRSTTAKIHQIEIIERVMYNGYDLNGADFDVANALQRSWQFVDCFDDKNDKKEFHHSTRMSRESSNISTPSGSPRKNMMRDTLRLNSIRMDFMPNLELQYSDDDDDVIAIELPLYSTRMVDVFSEMDLAINQTTMKLSFLLKNNYKSWHNAIFCPLYSDRNSFLKCFMDQIITHPEIEKSIKSHAPQVHFWRIIKFGIRMSDWTIDPNVIEMTIRYYDDWLLSEEHWLAKSLDKIVGYKYFTKHFFTHGYAKDLNGYTKMMQVFDVLKCKNLMIDALNHQNHFDFKKHWVETLNKLDCKDKDNIGLLLKKNGFPVGLL